MKDILIYLGLCCTMSTSHASQSELKGAALLNALSEQERERSLSRFNITVVKHQGNEFDLIEDHQAKMTQSQQIPYPERLQTSSIRNEILSLADQYRFLKTEPALEAAISGTWKSLVDPDASIKETFHFNVNTSFEDEATIAFEIWNKHSLVLSYAMHQSPCSVPVQCPPAMADVYKLLKSYASMPLYAAAHVEYPSLFSIVKRPFVPKIYIEIGEEISPTYRFLIRTNFLGGQNLVCQFDWKLLSSEKILQSLEKRFKVLTQTSLKQYLEGEKAKRQKKSMPDPLK